MRGILNASAILLGLDLAVELGGHPLEFGNHRFDLDGPAALFVHLELP